MRLHVFVSFLLVFFIGGCTSVESLLDKGEYEKAFNVSLSKLRGSREKETKYVSALEKSFEKLNKADRRKIESWDAPNKPEHWDDVVVILKNMQGRQEKVEPLLPLKSKSGYKASFVFEEYTKEIRQAEDQACLYHFEKADQLISQTQQSGLRKYARDAYEELKKIEVYKSNYPNLEKQKNLARAEGTTIIFFHITGLPGDMMQQAIVRELQSLPVSGMDRFWYNYSVDAKDKEAADYVAEVSLENLFIGPDRERINSYTESKEVVVSKESKKEKRDSTDVVVEKEIIEKVRAEVNEVYREKKSSLQGRLQIKHKLTGEYVVNTPLEALQEFQGYGCKYNGDERALTPATKKKLDGFLEFFPTDYDTAVKLAVVFREGLLREINKFRFD